MRPTYTKSGFNYLPVIDHGTYNKEVLYGDPLANGITATKYAALAIRDRRNGAASLHAHQAIAERTSNLLG